MGSIELTRSDAVSADPYGCGNEGCDRRIATCSATRRRPSSQPRWRHRFHLHEIVSFHTRHGRLRLVRARARTFPANTIIAATGQRRGLTIGREIADIRPLGIAVRSVHARAVIAAQRPTYRHEPTCSLVRRWSINHPAASGYRSRRSSSVHSVTRPVLWCRTIHIADALW